MMLKADDIKPEIKGKSDFFSWQLYRWVKANPKRVKVWLAAWNSVTGIDFNSPTLYIGDDRDGSWIHARQLRSLCTRGANLTCMAYGPAHGTENWLDVTEQFWADYLRIGVCAIHGDYAHDWEVTGDKRICKHCSKQEKQVATQLVVKEWVAV